MEHENTDAVAWINTEDNDLWVFDKLIVARRFGYLCGPTGVPVPIPGWYIVRPCINVLGMGRGAEYQFIENSTDHLPLGYFWCEIFKGTHLSIDYRYGEQILSVEGIRTSSNLWKFSCWKVVKVNIPLPEILIPLANRYQYVNIEYIGQKVVEIHLRNNPDFVYGNTVAYPVWNDGEYDSSIDTSKLKYIESRDFKRVGFYID